MSNLPGGPADKGGLRHEALWGVFGIIEVLSGEADAIRIEEPGTDGAEFYLERGGGHEHWQAKRQVLSQKTWSLQLLKSEGVLDFFRQRVDAGELCVFASISDAPELRALAENAEEALDWPEFEKKFVSSEHWKEHFKELRKHLAYRSGVEVFAFLRKIRVEGARESTLEALLLPIFKAWLTGQPQTALSILRDLYAGSVHRRLTADNIRKHLDSHGIRARTLPVTTGLPRFLRSITDAYVAGQRAKLIRGESIPRQTAADIVKMIKESDRSLDILVTAPAGGGKSAGLLQVVESLASSGIPVLAFRLDRIEPVASTGALGEKLHLQESPAIVLSQCHPDRAVALVVDQLDFVSATSGRHPDFLEVVAALAEEIRGLRKSQQIHLVMACRQFDFDNDSRIRRLLPPNVSPMLIGSLSDAEVKNVIAEGGGDPGRLLAKQIELLRLPQNLSLFVESGLAQEKEPSFVTQKELFDGYWEAKRRAVSDRRPQDAMQWNEIIATLTEEMSKREELSVPKSRLDQFAPEFLAAMVSEGILTSDGRRYGFGHESLFDYCFARNVAGNETEFIQFLENDQQQLFRRAQLRQVLVYLRDDDFKRYIENVQRALASGKIRPHLKLLVLELIASFPDARDEELRVLTPYLQSELDCQRKNLPNPDKIASRAWEVFFTSRTLFTVADRLGYVARWLNSKEDWLEDRTTFYLRWQAESHGDRVAGQLEPFIGRGGKWSDRLRFIMEWVKLGNDHRLFNLFLRLLDNGTLDDARDRFATNGTFWSMLHGLAEQQPAWCAEVAAHWLDRQVAIAKAAAAEGQQPRLELNDQFGVDDLFQSAKGAPKEFLEQVLPAILRASEAFAVENSDGLSRDRIWPIRFRSQYIRLKEAYLGACETAFEAVGNGNAEALRPFVVLLRQSRLYTANHLLLSAYASAPGLFADEAMALLSDDPVRFQCGFSDSPFWVSRTLIEKCSAHCSDQTFKNIEAAVLEITTPYERSKEGFRRRGHYAYTLASALASHRRSAEATTRLAEWQRKFSEPEGPPRGICGYSIVSPIPKEGAEYMSDEQWLHAIAKYETDRGSYDWKHPERGGAAQLAGLFQGFVKNYPERFARLTLKFPKGTNTSYFMNVLYGLKDASVDPQLKVDVARRVFNVEDAACLMAALDLLASIEEIPLPDDAVQFIRRMATGHPDPEQAAEQDKDLLFRGIDSVRGHGVEAIRDLVLHDKSYLEIFGNEIDQCVRDPSLAVRACAASTMLAVAVHDAPKAIALFTQLLDADDRLLATRYVDDFLARGLREHIDKLRPIVERMLHSEIEKVRQAGGRLACLARLYHHSLDDLSETAMAGDAACRLGATEVASQNLTHPECRPWCEAALRRLFDDEDANVRRHAAGCFWHLWQQPEVPLTDYDALLRLFLGSRSFSEEPTYLLHALDDTRQRVPETILDVCETFVTKCKDKARDVRTGIAADEATVGKLVFRAYAQLEALPLRARALDLIDRMCVEGLQSAGKHLTEFER